MFFHEKCNYLPRFTAVFGSAVLSNSEATLAAMGKAIAAYESEDPVFRPFTSKYDAYVAGKATLSPQQAAGLAAFTASSKGNCASCHTITSINGGPALFTNFSYHTNGAPRNWNIPYNLDSTPLPAFVPENGTGLGAPNHNYYDMGLCGPVRTDLAANVQVCGSFKTPSLRNIALKRAYYHNGFATKLTDVISFYATRNSNPNRWYQKSDGTPDILYNDLPVQYHGNVEPIAHPGGPLSPNLSPTDVQNVFSFLCTLTDGYNVANPTDYNTSGQCAGVP